MTENLKNHLESLGNLKGNSGFSFSKNLSFVLLLSPAFLWAQVDPVFVNALPSILDEASGIECVHPDTCWTHNDNNDGARIYLLDGGGVFLGQRTLSEASQVDYEDICKDTDGNIYVGDFGNNDNDRQDLVIYRSSPSTEAGSLVDADRIEFTLEDQASFPPPDNNLNFDIEGMVHHGGFLYLFTRNRTIPFNGVCKMYRLPADPGTYVASLTGSFFGNFSEIYSSITAAAISPSGGRLALLTNGSLYLFTDLLDGPDISGSSTYNFFTFTPAFEGISFVDECLTYLVTEADNSGPASLYSLNTCDILTSLTEEYIELPLTYSNGRLAFRDELLGSITLFDTSGRILFQSGRGFECDLPGFLPSGIYVAMYALEDVSGTMRFHHQR